MSDKPSSVSESDCCKIDSPILPDEKNNTQDDDVPPPLPPDRHKQPVITSSLASIASFTTAIVSFNTAEASLSATNNTDLTDDSLPGGAPAGSSESMYSTIEFHHTVTENNRRLLACCKMISRKETVKVGSLILAMLLISATTAVSIIMSPPHQDIRLAAVTRNTSSTRQPDTSNETSERRPTLAPTHTRNPSFDHRSPFTIELISNVTAFVEHTNTSTKHMSQLTGLKTTNMFGERNAGMLFSGEVAYKAGGPLTGLKVWSGPKISWPPEWLSVQAKHGSYMSERLGVEFGEVDNIELSDNEFITKASVTHNNMYICKLAFRSSLGREFGPYKATAICTLLSSKTEKVTMGRLVYISGRCDSSLRAISFTYID